MEKPNLPVLIAVSLISLSGICINIFKKSERGQTVSVQDHGTLFLLRTLILIALISSILLYFSECGRVKYPVFIIYFGHLFVITGLILRWMVVVSMGAAFTVKVSIIKGHSLITNGLFKYIRHPSYSALILYYSGLGLIMQNWICLLILLILPVFAVFKRIITEEAVLTSQFGQEYTSYKQNSNKLIPYIY